MPCRCCGASRPSKGFTEKGEAEINDLLKQAAKLILDKDDGSYEDIDQWKRAWQEAFDHHLNGCKELTNEQKTLKYMLEQATKPHEMRCECGSIKARDGEPFTHYCCDCKCRLI